MKPYVICYMMSSVDGRILPDRWHPSIEDRGVYERLRYRFSWDTPAHHVRGVFQR